MRFSVVIPSHNGDNTLADTLGALAGQVLPPDEVIVVDDGSTDDTPLIVKRFSQVTYVRQPQSGPAAARNAGARKANGEVVAFIDDDCIPPPDWIRLIRSGFEKYPEVGCVGGPYRPPEPELSENPYAMFQWQYERAMLPPVGYINFLTGAKFDESLTWSGEPEYVGGIDCPAGLTGNVSYKLDLFLELGGFDETFPLAAAEDADLKIRFCLAGHQALWLDSLVVEHRDHFTARKFRIQHLRYGAGVVALERKYRGVGTPRWKAFLRLAKRGLSIFSFQPLVSNRVQWVRYKAGIYDALGQLLR